MNKIIFFLASVIVAVTFASEASALPVFARQTGMACSACHFQHFPMLNDFGRSFKAAGFTLMGAQTKVEGVQSDNLSIPEVLNMGVLTTAGYVKTNAAVPSSAVRALGYNNDGNGTVYVPGTNGELSLFFGGHVSENVGFLAEFGMVGAAGLGSAKLPVLYEVAEDTRAGVVLFTTDAQGASYGFEELNTGANAVHTMLFVGGDANGSVAPALSAQQYIGTATAATGAAIVVNSSKGFINLTKFHRVGPADLRGGGASSPAGASQTGATLGSTYLRVAGTFDIAGWDSGIGIQSWSGSSADNTATAGALADTKATAIDGQMQGAVGKMPLGIYASYARAPSGTTNGNVYNVGGIATRSAFNVSAELGVIPEKATVGLGMRRGKSGNNAGTGIAGANDSDNAWLIEGSYKLAQNMMLNLVFVSQSGNFWSTANSAATGSKQTSINLATIF